MSAVPWWRWQEGERPPGWWAAERRRALSGPRCSICGEREPDAEFLPFDLVALANGLVVGACSSCWMRWPTDHKQRAERVAP
jgi:hypothetical protein